MDKLSTLARIALERWTKKSPKTYRLITDISLGVGLAATALPFLPIILPAWVIPTSAFLVALSAKLTIENKSQSNQ